MRLLDRIRPFALFALRVVLGTIMLAHSLPKITGGMEDVHKTVGFVASLGLPGWMATLASGAELIGGAALVLGAVTRFFAFIILIDMLVAIVKVYHGNGLTGPGGYEFPLSLAAVAFAVIILGAGPISMDWLFARKKGF